MRLKDVTVFNSSSLGEKTPDDYTFRYIDISSVSKDGEIHYGNPIQFYEAPSRARRIVKEGDIIISTVRTYLRAIATIEDANDVIVSTGFAVFSPNQTAYAKYLEYAIRSTFVIDQICSNSKGVSYPAIQAGILSAVEIPYHNSEEQEAIAAYLDKECGSIGKKVDLLEQKADRYRRLRRAIINQAVTRGLNPDVELKESGIEWIGKIPSHWNIERGKALLREVDREVSPEDGTVTCFRDGQVTLRSKRRTTGFTESLQEIGYHGVRVGDLVIHQMDAFAGAIGISDSDGKCSPICSVCQPTNVDLVSLKYFCQLLRVMAQSGYIQALAKGIRVRTTDFRFKTLAALLFPLPSISEQQGIATYLDEKCDKIDEIVSKIELEISKLKELKRSLINEVVTGQRPIK
jgi:type I restriction enzyme S subunit